MFKRSLFGITLALLLISMLVQNLPAQPWRESQTTSTKFKEYSVDSLITINESEYIWYGDFIVNETDTVIIKNCIFTVEDGYIYVYGSLEVENSTIEIRRSTFVKRIFVYGNFTLSKSIIKGRCRVDAYDNSRVSVFNSTFRDVFVAGGSVNISDSTMRGAGGGFIQNSNVGFAAVDTLPTFTQIISNSNITNVEIYVSRAADLELRPGYVENLTFSSEYGINSIINSFVENWSISNIYSDLRLINSTIEDMMFDVMRPFDGTAALKLRTGFIEYQNIYVENNYFNITVMNSTVKEWELTVFDGNIDIRDSSNVGVYCASSTEPLTHPNVSIHNSTMTYVVARDLSGNVTVFDSLANSMMFSYSSGSMNFSLQEGYQDYINFYNEAQNSNVTLVRTIVNHWGVELSGNATVNIINSTITGQHPDPFFAGLNLFQNSNATVYNSNLTGARLSQFASLTLINSTIDRIYAIAWASSLEVQKITAINSTIGTIITDPYQLELIGSTIMAEIHLPFAMSSEFISASVLDDCEVPLPEDIKQVSKYLHVTTTYDDIIEAQVRLYYDSYQLSELGISPDNLIIYTLDESSNDWRVCQIQGINQNKNYVWANVTHFSCFVIGLQKITPFLIGGPYYTWYGAEYWIVKIIKHPTRLVSNY